jgi:hypothetical protein
MRHRKEEKTTTRRRFLQGAVATALSMTTRGAEESAGKYVVPKIITLSIAPSLASAGSAHRKSRPAPGLPPGPPNGPYGILPPSPPSFPGGPIGGPPPHH